MEGRFKTNATLDASADGSELCTFDYWLQLGNSILAESSSVIGRGPPAPLFLFDSFGMPKKFALCVQDGDKTLRPAKFWIPTYHLGETAMSKGMDKKKETKKKPAKSLEEKRAAKREKKENRKFMSQ